MKALAGVGKLVTLTITLSIIFQLGHAKSHPIFGQTNKGGKPTEKDIAQKGMDQQLQSTVNDIRHYLRSSQQMV